MSSLAGEGVRVVHELASVPAVFGQESIVRLPLPFPPGWVRAKPAADASVRFPHVLSGRGTTDVRLTRAAPWMGLRRVVSHASRWLSQP